MEEVSVATVPAVDTDAADQVGVLRLDGADDPDQPAGIAEVAATVAVEVVEAAVAVSVHDEVCRVPVLVAGIGRQGRAGAAQRHVRGAERRHHPEARCGDA